MRLFSANNESLSLKQVVPQLKYNYKLSLNNE